MTAPQENQQQNQEQKPNDKELNFRALEAKYQRQLEQERQARLEAERRAEEIASKKEAQQEDDDERNDDPYVDHKKLEKKLNRFGQSTKSEIQKAMEIAKETAKEEVRRELWLEQNPDFYDVLQHADKFAQKAPKLAETILRMPEGFERQKLVYQNIKELGVDKPPAPEKSIQQQIDNNKKGVYYQPSGMGTAPYNGAAGDFSPAGQKSAYAKLQELKSRLRI